MEGKGENKRAEHKQGTKHIIGSRWYIRGYDGMGWLGSADVFVRAREEKRNERERGVGLVAEEEEGKRAEQREITQRNRPKCISRTLEAKEQWTAEEEDEMMFSPTVGSWSSIVL